VSSLDRLSHAGEGSASAALARSSLITSGEAGGFVPRFLADAADMAAQLRSAESKLISSFRSQQVPHSENIARLFTKASARIETNLANLFRDGAV
jgi:hypothetical protein